jgi:hypothetical protein
VPYPPTVPPTGRVNATPQVDLHPSDHNQISTALTDIVNELGGNPSGASATVEARFDALAAALMTKPVLSVNGGPGLATTLAPGVGPLTLTSPGWWLIGTTVDIQPGGGGWGFLDTWISGQATSVEIGFSPYQSRQFETVQRSNLTGLNLLQVTAPAADVYMRVNTYAVSCPFNGTSIRAIRLHAPV